MRKPVCDVKPDEILVSDWFFSLLMFQEMKNHDFYRQCGMCKKINNSDIVRKPFDFPRQIKIIY